MFSTRIKFNSKRRFAVSSPREALRRLEKDVHYGGTPDHKRNPGDFGLSPPTRPRRDKSGILRRAAALRLLRLGIRRGMVSEWDGTGYPKNIWSMTDDGIPLDAQLENPANGTYHGYPLEANDPFRDSVIAHWNQSHA